MTDTPWPCTTMGYVEIREIRQIIWCAEKENPKLVIGSFILNICMPHLNLHKNQSAGFSLYSKQPVTSP